MTRCSWCKTMWWFGTEAQDLMRRLEKGIGFGVELRDDPLLRPDEFKLVVKGAGRDITSQYAVA